MRRKSLVAAFVCIAILALAVVAAKNWDEKAGPVLGKQRLQAGKFEGQYKDGRAHGQGVLNFPNGDRFEGRFADGGIYGAGMMYLANGDIYASSGRDSIFDSRGLQGCGAYVGAGGNRYMGQFRDGRFHGRGTYEWKNGKGATCGWR